MFGKKKDNTGGSISVNKKHTVFKLLGSFIVAAALFLVLVGIERNMLSDFDKKEAVISRVEVPRGTEITDKNVEKYFYMREVDAVLVDDTCVKDKSELEGTIISSTLSANEIVREDAFSEEMAVYQKFKEPAEGSFVSDVSNMVSGTIRQGDYVDIAVVNKDTLEYVLQLKEVYVLDAFTNTGERVRPDNKVVAATMLTIVEEKDNLAKFYSAMELGDVIVTKTASIP